MSPRRAVSSSWNKMEAKQLSDIRDALYLLEAQLFVVQVGSGRGLRWDGGGVGCSWGGIDDENDGITTLLLFCIEL